MKKWPHSSSVLSVKTRGRAASEGPSSLGMALYAALCQNTLSAFPFHPVLTSALGKRVKNMLVSNHANLAPREATSLEKIPVEQVGPTWCRKATETREGAGRAEHRVRGGRGGQQGEQLPTAGQVSSIPEFNTQCHSQAGGH